MIPSASLFDAPASPAVAQAGQWLIELLAGSLATTISIIAVAVLGMMMLAGRLSLQRSMQVVVGCFMLLGASSLASELHQAGRSAIVSDAVPVVIEPVFTPEAPLPPANYDPYAGASLRRR